MIGCEIYFFLFSLLQLLTRHSNFLLRVLVKLHPSCSYLTVNITCRHFFRFLFEIIVNELKIFSLIIVFHLSETLLVRVCVSGCRFDNRQGWPEHHETQKSGKLLRFDSFVISL